MALSSGTAGVVGKGSAGFKRHFFLPAVDNLIDVGRHLTPDDCPHESHQAFRFSEVPAPNGLYNDEEYIVDFVLEFLRAQAAIQEETHAARKQCVKLLHAGRIALADLTDQQSPVYRRTTALFRVHRAILGFVHRFRFSRHTYHMSYSFPTTKNPAQ